MNTTGFLHTGDPLLDMLVVAARAGDATVAHARGRRGSGSDGPSDHEELVP